MSRRDLTYVGREIRMTGVSSTNAWHPEPLTHSTLLVMFEHEFEPTVAGRTFLASLIGQLPLAVVVCGNGARAAFDALICELSKAPTPKHIMSKLCEEQTVEDCVDDFLRATWPADERFDEWDSYQILVVGAGRIAEVQAVVTQLTAKM
jgi:hypothetical protein